jgi:hypothetical protein
MILIPLEPRSRALEFCTNLNVKDTAVCIL